MKTTPVSLVRRRNGSGCNVLISGLPMPESSERSSDIRSGLTARLAFIQRFPFAVLAVWLVLYGPRPFRLGLYHDDWANLIELAHGTAPFWLTRLHTFVTSDRMVDGFLMFLVSSFAGTSAFLYQLIAAVFVLMAALSLRAWFTALLPERDFPARTLAADLAVIFWLSIPWSVASAAWPLLAPAAMGTQILFTEASRRILRARPVDTRALVILGLTLLVSYLLYEPFYLQFFIVTCFYLVFERETFKTRFSSRGLIVAAVGAQCLAVAINRITSPRQPSAHWFDSFMQSLEGVPHQLEISVGAYGEVWTGVVKACLIMSLVLALRGLIDRRLLGATKRLLGIFMVGTVALPLAVLMYSLGGLGATSVGVGARSLHCVSWALAIVFFSLVSILTLPHGKLARLILLLTLLSIIGLDSIGQYHIVNDWAFVWRQEKEVLAHTPVQKIKSLPFDARVLYIGPSYYHGMVIFGASWDITGAVYSLPLLSEGRKSAQERTTIHSAALEYNWRWDGKNLIQEEPGYWTQNWPASKLFVWNYEQGDVVEAAAGYRLAARN